VTRFDLETLPAGPVWGGIRASDKSQGEPPQWLISRRTTKGPGLGFPDWIDGNYIGDALRMSQKKDLLYIWYRRPDMTSLVGAIRKLRGLGRR
jgi:hypothetical protein